MALRPTLVLSCILLVACAAPRAIEQPGALLDLIVLLVIFAVVLLFPLLVCCFVIVPLVHRFVGSAIE